MNQPNDLLFAEFSAAATALLSTFLAWLKVENAALCERIAAALPPDYYDLPAQLAAQLTTKKTFQDLPPGQEENPGETNERERFWRSLLGSMPFEVESFLTHFLYHEIEWHNEVEFETTQDLPDELGGAFVDYIGGDPDVRAVNAGH